MPGFEHDPAHHDPECYPELAPPPAAGAGPDRSEHAIDWLNLHARAFLTLAVVFQVAVLLAMVVIAARPMLAADSRTVLLQVAPVDPRDPFRGDFVNLSYAASRATYHIPAGSTVYVPLIAEPDGRHYRSGDPQRDPPAQQPYLRGRVVRPGWAEFGIEKYFVPEGQGHTYEQALIRRRVWAELIVARDGQALLNRLVIE